ncbi:hypothetical protein IE53DRAFT_391178 [Violaceomyces palustris]|uniref:Uncharacterized protein n=1 Tax=Violaceomyces palustris TaxID=1673888 RepID=A0ACD0NLD6_9BASI|nr:hypothetical protein IE53DRAFT_391178 [Violaceomyces palustris]
MHISQGLAMALALGAATTSSISAVPLHHGVSHSKGVGKLMVRSVQGDESPSGSGGVGGGASAVPNQAYNSGRTAWRVIPVSDGEPKTAPISAQVLKTAADPIEYDVKRSTLVNFRNAVKQLTVTVIKQKGALNGKRQLDYPGLQKAVHGVSCVLDGIYSKDDEDCADVITEDYDAKLNLFTSQLQQGSPIDSAAQNLYVEDPPAEDPPAEDPPAERRGLWRRRRRSVERLLEKRQDDGAEAPADPDVTGLQASLKDLLDAIIDTVQSDLRVDSNGYVPPAGVTNWGVNCPPPGTPNDGLYRPGCRGYGRRDLRSSLGERNSDVLQNIVPFIQMLMDELPVILKEVQSASGVNLSTNSTATASNTTNPTTSKPKSVKVEQPSSRGDIRQQQQPISGAKSNLAFDTRSLLEADGLLVSERDGGDLPSPSGERRFAGKMINGLVDGMLEGRGVPKDQADFIRRQISDSVGDETSSSSINARYLDSLLNGFVRGLERRGGLEEEDKDSDRHVLKRLVSGQGLIPNLLDGLVGRRDDLVKVAEKDSGTETTRRSTNEEESWERKDDGGVNAGLVDQLIQGVLIKRSGETEKDHLIRKADFKPVWEEIRKVGDRRYLTSSRRRRSTSSPPSPSDFAPVWNAFRDLMDTDYHSAAASTSVGGPKRRGKPGSEGGPFESLPRPNYTRLVKASSRYARALQPTQSPRPGNQETEQANRLFGNVVSEWISGSNR